MNRWKITCRLIANENNKLFPTFFYSFIYVRINSPHRSRSQVLWINTDLFLKIFFYNPNIHIRACGQAWSNLSRTNIDPRYSQLFQNNILGFAPPQWPSAARTSVVGYDGYLAASQDVRLSRHAGSRREHREQLSDIFPEVKNEL